MSHKEQLRIIPITSDFMQNKKIYDRIWGYMQLNSYIGYDLEKQKHRFIYKDFTSNYDLYKRINTKVQIYDEKTREKKEKNFFSYNTFVNSLKILQDKEYITPGKIIDNRKTLIDVYYLKEDFTPFKMIPYNTLEYLINTNINNSIKIYTTLLNWSSFKRNYRFTLEELAAAVGYSSKCRNKNIQDILYKLKIDNLVLFHKEKISNSTGQAVYYYFLDQVNLQKPNTSPITPSSEERQPIPAKFVF